MDCDAEEPTGDRGFEEFETVLEGTDSVLLVPEQLACGGVSYSSVSGEENTPLHSKDIVEPGNISSDVRFGETGSKQSAGRKSLLGSNDTRKESVSDATNAESSDNKYSESEDMKVETNGNTEEYHHIKKTVTNGNVISSSKVHEELNVKEREGEHDEAHERQKEEIKEVNDKEERELKDHNKVKEKINEVSNNKKRNIEEIRDKGKNETEVVADNKMKKNKKVCNSEHNEIELSEKKKEIEELSDEGKEKGELSVNGEKAHAAVKKPGIRESQAVEMLGSENKETAEKTSESGKTVSKRQRSLVGAGSEECEMDINDSDPFPDHINFVDVNAPNCDSPMVIDDDDDDDVVMIERRKGTSQSGMSENKEKGKTDDSNRDSSPEVVVQEELGKKHQDIVIDLDDDDDIEIETIKKKKKKKKSSAAKGVCCCNIECSASAQDLRSAPVFVLTYYGRKYKKGKAEKVCTACFEAAMQHYEVGVCVCVCVCVGACVCGGGCGCACVWMWACAGMCG
jgi:hypothetical protein